MYKLFSELSEGEKFWFYVYVGKELKNIYLYKKGNYGIPVNEIPTVKKVKMLYNDLVQK